MLPHRVSHFLDRLLLITLNKIPIRLMRRFLMLLQTHPNLTDKWEYYIRQFHYYEPFPEFSKIHREQVLKRRYSDGIDWQLNHQLELIKRFSVYKDEIPKIADQKNPALNFDFFNDLYRELDAAIYYSILRDVKPATVIEIGSGYSTQIAAIALSANQQEGKDGKMICIEPYPQPMLTQMNQDLEIIPQKLETIELSFFKQLHAGDILFIDSTHTVKFGSDVFREILEILPRLASGVWIHFHDIFFPYDYPPKWLIEERRAWNEQYMLEAFLAYNSQFEVILANHWLAVDYPQEVAKIWPGVLKWEEPYHKCGSLWLRKK